MSNYMAKMVNGTFAYQNRRCVHNEANVAFIVFAIYLLISIHILVTYLPGANLCKSFFRPLGRWTFVMSDLNSDRYNSKILKYDSRYNKK